MSPTSVRTVEEWTHACSGAFVPLKVRSTAPDFAATLSQVALGPNVTVTRVSSAASTVFRDDDLIRRHPRDDLLVSLHRRGSGSVRQHGRAAALGYGSAALYDAATPYALSFPGTMSEVVLQVPRRTLSSVGNAFSELTAVPLPDSAQLRALTMLASAVDARAVEGEAEALGEALVALLRSIATARRDDHGPAVDPRLLLEGIRLWIDEHASDPDLTPERVARNFHVSLRTLQKIFADGGESPAAVIRRCRLRRGRSLLMCGSSVAEAARRSGFLDVDSFTRAFRREFDLTPSAARATEPERGRRVAAARTADGLREAGQAPGDETQTSHGWTLHEK